MLYFVKLTKTGKGIVVSNKPLQKRTVTFKGGQEREMSVQMSGLVFGFFAVSNAASLGYEPGELVENIKLSDTRVLPDNDKLFWCDPVVPVTPPTPPTP